MGIYRTTMSYGGGAGLPLILGSMAVTCYASNVVHQMIIGSGAQPTTMSAEFKAAEVARGFNKPCQSTEGKTMMQNPVFNSSFDWATSRAGKFMLKEGESIK